DPERHAVVALLGGSLRKTRHRLLVVAGFTNDCVPPDRRIESADLDLRWLPANGLAARDQAALPEGRRAEPQGARWSGRYRRRRNDVDQDCRQALRLHSARDMAA